MGISTIRCQACGKELSSDDTPCPSCEAADLQLQIPPKPTEKIGLYVDGKYVPNEIPFRTRFWGMSASVVLIAYGSFGVFTNDLYIPGKRGNGSHLHGFSAWVMFGAMIFATCNLVLTIVDHYDRRENEERYRFYVRLTKYIAWTLFVAAFLFGMTLKQSSIR
jgi:hypothetical protein